MSKFKRIFSTVLFVVFLCEKAQADIVFPAIAHQFAVSLVIPSYYSILLAVAVLIIEGFFIKRFFIKNWFYSLGLAFLINFASSILGVFIVSFLEFFTRSICMGIFGYANMRIGTYLGMMPGYVITVLVEWLLLLNWTLLRCKNRFESKNLFKLSLMMNFSSYLILLLGIFLADILTHGKNFITS